MWDALMNKQESSPRPRQRRVQKRVQKRVQRPLGLRTKITGQADQGQILRTLFTLSFRGGELLDTSSVRAGTYRGSDRLIHRCVLGPEHSAWHMAVTQGRLVNVGCLLGTKEVLSKGRLRVMEQQ